MAAAAEIDSWLGTPRGCVRGDPPLDLWGTHVSGIGQRSRRAQKCDVAHRSSDSNAVCCGGARGEGGKLRVAALTALGAQRRTFDTGNSPLSDRPMGQSPPPPSG